MNTISYSDAVAILNANIDNGDRTPVMLLGAPGCGKTSVVLDIAEQRGIPRDVAESCIFRPSLRDPVDLMGLPHTERHDNGELWTHWSINSFFQHVNNVAERYGVALLCIDELPQAVPMMQNALAGLLYDRCVGDNHLHDNVYMFCTGNRAEDKAGSGRVLSQVANRIEIHTMATDLDAWAAYMIGKDYDPMLVAYIRFDPAALEDIDPDRLINGTMRSWEAAAKVDTNLPANVYRAKLCGRVPEGRVAQYLAFRDLFHELPSADDMCNSPLTAQLPSHNRGALFAAASLAYKRANAETFANLTKYVGRIATEAMAVDIEAMFYKDVTMHKPELCNTSEFGEWASGRGAEVML